MSTIKRASTIEYDSLTITLYEEKQLPGDHSTAEISLVLNTQCLYTYIETYNEIRYLHSVCKMISVTSSLLHGKVTPP